MNIYIASPFFNESQLKTVKLIEDTLSKYGFAFFSPRLAGNLGEKSEYDKSKAKRDIFNGNIAALENCDSMVAVIDDRDIGTIWEMGYAYKNDMRTISYSANGYGLNIMLAESVQAHVTDIESLVTALHDPSFTGEINRGLF